MRANDRKGFDVNDALINRAMAGARDAEDAGVTAPRRPTPEYVARCAAYMTDNGYDAREPDVHNRLAMFLAYRKMGLTTKGLMLLGPPGTGKTIWLKKFGHCRVEEAKGIARRWRKDGGEATMTWLKPPRYDVLPLSVTQMALDDLGDEPVVNEYGTKVECMVDVLSARYNLFQNHGVKYATYIATNLTEVELSDRYKARIFSRLSAMCTFITFTGPDSRLGETRGD